MGPAADGCLPLCGGFVLTATLEKITLTGSEITRSSATAEKQRVSYACISRLANSSCNSLNNADVAQLDYI